MRTLPCILITAALTLFTGGCEPATSNWSPVESPKQLQVETGRRVFDVAFARGQTELSAAELVRLNGFIASGGVQADDRITLLSDSHDGRLNERRSDRLTAALRRQGVGAMVTQAVGGSAPDRVTLIVEHAVVSLPNCPDWSKNPNDYTGAVASNFGCATATNLGLMVADPQDLAGGRALGPADGTLAASSVHDYRIPPQGGAAAPQGSGGFAPTSTGSTGNAQ